MEPELIPFLDPAGQLTSGFEGRVGVYAIYDQAQALQYVGYSRDVGLSLKQHLVRQPQGCYWLRVETIERPNRTQLEEIRDAWLADWTAKTDTPPPGNAEQSPLWNQPIDAKTQMTEAEQSAYEASDELGKIKTLKQAARRVEAEVLAALETRGVKIPIRFDPKAKETGLLDVKS
ncbi:MAG: GIY-YIG nuclease family protein [Elainella sp.]